MCHVRGAIADTGLLCTQLLLIYTTSVANDAFGTRAGRTVILVYAAQVRVLSRPRLTNVHTRETHLHATRNRLPCIQVGHAGRLCVKPQDDMPPSPLSMAAASNLDVVAASLDLCAPLMHR